MQDYKELFSSPLTAKLLFEEEHPYQKDELYASIIKNVPKGVGIIFQHTDKDPKYKDLWRTNTDLIEAFLTDHDDVKISQPFGAILPFE